MDYVVAGSLKLLTLLFFPRVHRSLGDKGGGILAARIYGNLRR